MKYTRKITRLADLRKPVVAGLVAVWLLQWTVGAAIADRPAFSPSQKTIVLDPGHGGDDTGARGPGGSLEKERNLALAGIIADTCGEKHRIVLTRSGDHRMALMDRTAVANQQNADLFISLHTGGSFLHSAEGMNVYFFEDEHLPVNGQAPPAAAGSLDIGAPIPWDRLQDRHHAASRNLAVHLHRALKERISPAMDQIQGLPLLVLRGADMPAVLVEIGYITNPSEERALKTGAFLSATAEAVCAGIDRYFE